MTPKNQYGPRSSGADVRRIGERRSRSVSPTSSSDTKCVPDAEEREMGKVLNAVVPGTVARRRHQSLSPDITSFRPTKSYPPLLRSKQSSTPVRKVDTKPQSIILEASKPKNRDKRRTLCSAETMAISIEFVSKRCQRGEALDLQRLSSDTSQAVEKTTLLQTDKVELPSVSPKGNLPTDKKKTESFNDNESVRAAVADFLTPRNEKEEPKKPDGIATPSLIPERNSPSPLPTADWFCSLSAEISNINVVNWLEETHQCDVTPNLNNGGACSSTQAAAVMALPSSSSAVVPISKEVKTVTESAKKSTTKAVGKSRKKLPVPAVKVVDGKSTFLQDGKKIEVDADPKLRTEVSICDPDVPWICSFCHLGPHVMIRMPNNRGYVSPYGMGDLFGPYFANLPSIYGKPSPRRETWMHGDCALWAGSLILVLTILKNLEKTLLDADKEVCTICHKTGATISCVVCKCNVGVHFHCATLSDWKLDSFNFLAYCPRHR
ncbi:unnamed protein product [Orchesella dallaii]|uniref:PHD-type domain-containing protein n=1 Tax=Orchesella dallaii TaxID=48710 RepID=A0ABP1RBU2_9HEXA